ncbi:hypothetical protein FKP32DRAFT_1585306 [Trametes sanguinea]|nr:hypothetical protein FKP32DRAFT_1585306 [Trametes sanguinea]
MVLKYEEYARLKRGTKGGVASVAFSSKGSYIAVAGTFDCTVYIWRVSDQKLMHTYKGSSPYLSLLWLPGSEDALLCGSQGGCLDHLQMTPAALDVAGFRGHRGAVECLSVRDDLLASGAQSEVIVWNELEAGVYRRTAELPPPPRSSHNEHSEILATGVHWIGRRRQSSLLVSYMFHGVVIYNPDNWTALRTIPTPGMV